MGKNDRFQIIYTQGITDITRILLDTRTGVLYLQTVSGYAGGLTPLLQKVLHATGRVAKETGSFIVP